MRNTKHLHPHRLVNIGIVFVMAGFMIFFYGLILSDPFLYTKALELNGSENMLHGAAPDMRSSQEIFIMATFLIVSGAGLDVKRRLQEMR